MNRHIIFPALACLLAAMGLTLADGPSAHAAAKKKKAGVVEKTTDAEQAAISSGVLTQQEAKLSCKRMAGQLQVRILEHRGGGARKQSSGTSQVLQSAVTPLFGGTQRGTDGASEAARDIAKINAMNQILVSRNCPYYDVAAELKMDQKARAPKLIRPQQKAKATKK
jgi:hypothetical protein